VKATSKILSQEKRSPLDGIHIRPHPTDSNTVVIYNEFTPLGYVEFKDGKSFLNWAVPYRQTYITCRAELPFKSLWDDFTPEDAQYLATQFLMKQSPKS
jgi:hypothetical protein